MGLGLCRPGGGSGMLRGGVRASAWEAQNGVQRKTEPPRKITQKSHTEVLFALHEFYKKMKQILANKVKNPHFPIFVKLWNKYLNPSIKECRKSLFKFNAICSRENRVCAAGARTTDLHQTKSPGYWMLFPL